MTARNTRRALWGAGIAAATAMLLRRMRGDFERDHRFRPSTAAMVYASYGIQLALAAELMAHPTRRLPIPRGTALVLGGTLGVTGAGTFALAGDVFGSARQLSGTETGHLIDQGVYQVSRNPQYLGYLTLLAGATVASRSLDAVLSTAATAAVFGYWIRREETNLTELFGDEYRDYRASTARRLGQPCTHNRRSAIHRTQPN